MSERDPSSVDLSYRGLALGKRIKLTQVRPTTGFLEMPTPMPVGTAIGISTDDGVLLEAIVAEIHEQVTGSEKVAGMLVKPKLDADAARTWWTAHLTGDKVAKEAPLPDAEGRVVVKSPRMSGEHAIPELTDDGRNTSVMEAISEVDADSLRDTNPVQEAVEPDPRTTIPGMVAQRDSSPIIDDGKRTMAMDAVDLEALGLDPTSLAAASSGSMPAVSDDDANGNGDKPDGKSKKKKKKR